MRILFSSPGKIDDWIGCLRAELPDAAWRVWDDHGAPDQAAGFDADYAIAWKPPAALFAGQPRLKGIFCLGAGVDALVALGDALPAGVPLVRIEDAGMGLQMAEYVTYAVLRHYREFDVYEQQARAGQWRPRRDNLKADFPVGILGLGVLGQRIAEALLHFGFTVHGWSRGRKSLPGVICHSADEHGDAALDAVLRASRILVCALPLTPDTRGILNRTSLAKTPRGAYLVNVARGAHLVEEDLLALLQEGQLSGATLDVFAEEPLPASHPFWREPRIAITPHTSAQSGPADCARQIARKIRSMERGEAITGIVDVKKGY